MINNIELYLTFENIYLISNWGVIPFWFLLLFLPNSPITKILVHSIIIPVLLSTAYIFVVYKIYFEVNLLEIFSLYLSLDDLYALYANEAFLLVFGYTFLQSVCFWVHGSQEIHKDIWFQKFSHL